MSAVKVLVIGDGAWGTALALQLVAGGARTTLWSAFAARTQEMRDTRRNERYLPGVELPSELRFSADPFDAADGAELVVSVVPTQHLRSVARRFEDALDGRTPIVTATKGLEIETLRRPSEILIDEIGERSLCVLTGPSHAEEVARGLPASLLAASQDAATAALVQRLFGGANMRIYTSEDPLGAELAGALKNVIALAAGICDGLGLGDNAKSALVTRGLVEMARFGVAQGARAETFFGLAGLGDLVTTCFSQHSRNRSVGERLGRGESLEAVLASMTAVAEGVATARALFGPEAEGRTARMPIAEQVHAILFEGKDARSAVGDLMSRAPASEMDGLFA